MAAAHTLIQAFALNFLGHSPHWYKLAITGFLLINPLLVAAAGPFLAGWCLIGEFIFCLAMALKCYPLQPGELLAPQSVAGTDGAGHDLRGDHSIARFQPVAEMALRGQ